MTVIEQIRLPAGSDEAALEKEIHKKLGLSPDVKIDYRIIKRSIDARKKPDIFFVYSVALLSDVKLKKYDKRHVKIVSREESYSFPVRAVKDIPENKRPVIVGFGPAGMFAAYELAKAGFCPIVLERGKDADARKKDVTAFWETGKLNEESNVSFGEGGAGTFSDGKLNTGIGSAGGRSKEILKIFVEHGAPESVLTDSKPHLGTDILTGIVKSMREEIIRLGGKVIFNAKLTGFTAENGSVTGGVYKDLNTGSEVRIETQSLCLCIGHSARDTFRLLSDAGVSMLQKDFAVGLRIAHPQKIIDDYVYGIADAKGRIAKGLPVADYKLTGQTDDKRGVYSFCMCPGGYVVNASTENGGTVVNGMSYSKRDADFANSAIVVTVSGKDFGSGLFDGMDFQRKLEKAAFEAGSGNIPAQYYGDFREKRISKLPEDLSFCTKGKTNSADLNGVLPDFVSGAIKEVMPHFGNRIKGFDAEDALLLGVESRTSSPVRIPRNEEFMTETDGLFPCGEGAGFAGGITSAAVDGIKVAEAVAKRILNRL